MAGKCPTITKAGKACKGIVRPGHSYCMVHEPGRKESLREAGRKGGAAKATSRRLAKQWAALGSELGNDDLTAILKSCMFAVKSGDMTPSEASAIATLARTAVAITNDLELVSRIEALEEAIQNGPSSIRRAS